MQRKKLNGLEWLEFDLLADIRRVKHAVFLRHGGYSTGQYQTLNTSFDVGDNFTAVEKNLKLIQKTMGMRHLASARQCHGNKMVHIKDSTSLMTRHHCDGFYTDMINTGLMISHADCQAAILYDPIHHAISNVHAGWRGSVQNIYSEAISAMKHAFGSQPSDLLVGISPSLGPHSAEFIHYQTELPREFHSFQIKPTYFDFWAISRFQLESCGVLSHHIEIAELDTYTNLHDCFSFRREKTTGRHGTILFLT